jgi:FAD-binding domain
MLHSLTALTYLCTCHTHKHTHYRMSAGQYCYVNVPWLTHTQWPPFSIMPETRADGKQGARYTHILYDIHIHVHSTYTHTNTTSCKCAVEISISLHIDLHTLYILVCGLCMNVFTDTECLLIRISAACCVINASSQQFLHCSMW